jgi:hypothetical protein
MSNLGKNGTIRGMRPGQVAGGHQELVDNFSAGEDEGFFADVNTITTHNS